MKPVQDILEQYVTKVKGEHNTMAIEVMNKQDAEKLDMNDILDKIGSEAGLYVRRGAYNALKPRLREFPLDNHMVEKDEATGYYKVSEWRNDSIEASIRVEYRIPLYTNKRGFEVKGNHLTLA